MANKDLDTYFRTLKKYKTNTTFYRKAKVTNNQMKKVTATISLKACNTKPLKYTIFSANSNIKVSAFTSNDSVPVNVASSERKTTTSPHMHQVADDNLTAAAVHRIFFEAPQCTLSQSQTMSDSECYNNNEIESEYYLNDSEDDEDEEEDFVQKIKRWAIQFNIAQTALKELLSIYNYSLKNKQLRKLPTDPRTLLSTPQKIDNIVSLDGGSYWHPGVKHCLELYFKSLDHPLSISLNINIDGIPIYRSSKIQFWPILIAVHEIDNFVPMVVGLYCGYSKPGSVQNYLKPLVDELQPLLENGIIINNNRIDIKIRCFICDAPARSMLKGTVNFNAYHGCLKCHVIGEYDNTQRNMSFPRTDMLRRTDFTFRHQLDKDHHKMDSPLLSLPIDMVDDIIVCDMLHQLHVGIMKKLLLCFTGQEKKMGFYSRWDHRRIKQVSEYLVKCTMPSDINRAVRPLDCLAFWKATEFRTFLHYIGPVVLRDFLPYDAYQHFLAFFCAVTICSSHKYIPFIDAADVLLKNFIEVYINIYGYHTIGTNVHNLCHLTEEVRRFGPLPSFSTYPFENKLFQIKRMLRTGTKPLVQVAKRLAEYNSLGSYKPNQTVEYPLVYYRTHSSSDLIPTGTIFYKKIEVNKSISLCNNDKNKWFLSADGQIVAMKYAVCFGNKKYVIGNSLQSKRDFFKQPMLSSSLDIYISNGETNKDAIYSVDQITAKFVCMCYKTEFVFIPLLHTL